MNKVILVSPGYGNGGIRSWTKKILNSFSNEDYSITHISSSRRTALNPNTKGAMRIIDGLRDLCETFINVRRTIKSDKYAIMHTTTSGGLGTLRDYVLAKYCKIKGLKTIMHCRYGCIPEDYAKRNALGRLLRKTMKLYDQVWVLDSRSEKALKSDPDLKNKVFLTPNSIQVPDSCNFKPKTYKNIAFVGNLIPSKGLYELVEAIVKSADDTMLTIIGPGNESVVQHIKEIAADKLDSNVKILGSLPNEEAVERMKEMDIVALPTYYQSEAFPISILESMSLGKLVISTPRAAIKDMLTSLDGSSCGILVREKSVDDIVKAITWCQENTTEADTLCKKAYEKVYTAYRTDVVYNLYRSLYTKVLLENNPTT